MILSIQTDTFTMKKLDEFSSQKEHISGQIHLVAVIFTIFFSNRVV